MASKTSMYNIDWSEVAKARKELGLKKTVNFHVKWMLYRNGTYLYTRDDVHQISVACDLSLQEVSDVIWHELTHAMQYEKYGDRFGDMYDEQLQAVGVSVAALNSYKELPEDYKLIPFEQEAIANEKKYRDWSLVTPVDPPKKRSKAVVSLDAMRDITKKLLTI